MLRRLLGANSIGSYIRIATLKRRLPAYLPRPVGAVFEAGCGSGVILGELRKLFPEARLAGVDIDPELAARAQRRLPDGKFWADDLTTMTGDASYDLVFNVDVIEHIEDYRAALRGMVSFLRAGGILALHTPNHVQRRLLPLGAVQKHEQDDHVREGFDLDDLARDLENEGLEVLHKERTVGNLGALLWEVDFLLRKLRPLNFVFLPLLKALASADIGSNHPRGNGLLLIARKK